MFDNDTVNAVLVAMALLLLGRWLAADKPFKWTPRIIRGKGGKK